MVKIVVDPKLCKACEYCIHFCPKGVMALGETMNENGYRPAVPMAVEKCIMCKSCAIMCPDGAISIYKE